MPRPKQKRYVFPTVIVVDREAWDDLVHHIKNPRPPGPGLLSIFKR